MTKNILRYDVVHHIINIMKTGKKIPLPSVALRRIFRAPALLNDVPASLFKVFLLQIRSRQSYGLNLNLKGSI